jgi:uroporphyrinogen decarboxylase
MGRREDFRKALNHVRPDDLLCDLGSSAITTMEGNSMYMLLDFLGYKNYETVKLPRFGRVKRLDERLLQYLGIDTRGVGEILTPLDSQFNMISAEMYVDEWGIKRVFTGKYWDIADCPLRGASTADLEAYRWPEPRSVDLKKVEAMAQEARTLFETTDYLVCADLPVHGVFELGCWMCGFDDFLVKMALDEDFVRRFFDIVLDYQKKIIEIYYGLLGPWLHYTASGDDFATQRSLFVSPEMFRRLIMPYFKERISYTKKFTAAAFLHHSCGSVFPIIDDLLACGVDILNPIQPKANGMSPRRLKEAYGDRIVFHGGIDTQEMLPSGNQESIEQNVRETLEILNENGGYIFAAAHNIQEDVPPENVVYMFQAARKNG